MISNRKAGSLIAALLLFGSYSPTVHAAKDDFGEDDGMGGPEDSAPKLEIKVLKAAGHKALVEFPASITPTKGSSYALGSATGGGGGSGSREYRLGLSAGFTKPIPGSSTLSLAPEFGWNMGSFEAGLRAALGSVAAGTTTSSSLSFGGFFDFNFVKNHAPETFVPGLTASFDFTTSAGSSYMTFGGGVFGKLYILGLSSTAIRLDLDFLMSVISGSLSKTLKFGGGLATYF